MYIYICIYIIYYIYAYTMYSYTHTYIQVCCVAAVSTAHEDDTLEVLSLLALLVQKYKC